MKSSVKKTVGTLLLSGVAASLGTWNGSDWETLGAWSSILAPSRAAAQGVTATDEEVATEEAEPLEGPPMPLVAEDEAAPLLLQPVEEEAAEIESDEFSPEVIDEELTETPIDDELIDAEPIEGEAIDGETMDAAESIAEPPLVLPGDEPQAPRVPAAVEMPSQESEPDAAPSQKTSGVMVEWITPKSINRGKETEFKLLVRNSMKHAAKNVAVHVQMPEHAELGKCNPKPIASEGVLLWKIGQMAAGSTKTITLGITPLEKGEIEPQAAVTFTRASSTRVAIVEPELSLKIESSPRAVIGQRGGCVLVVHNGGNGPATGVVVSANLPASLAPTTAEEAKYQLGTLPPGESREIEFPIYAHKLGQHALEFQVTCQGTEPKEIQQTLEVVQPTVQVAMEGPKLRYVERQASYLIRLENPGPAPINNVQVIENVPAGFEFVEATAGGDYDHEARQVAWFVGRLEPNASTTVEVKLIPGELGEHTVTTEVTADAGVNAVAHATTRVEGVSSVALDVIDRDDPIEVAGETLYEIRVTNNGTKPAAGVQIAAQVPKEMEPLEIGGPTEGSIDADKIIFEPLAELAPGATETFTVHVRCHGEGKVRFRAFFRTEESANPVSEEELTHIYAD
jgi:uncharacterized repeat protein (TIGR01451 family)